MDNSTRSTLLSDRLILHSDVSDAFVENMSLRLAVGIPKFGLLNCKIEPVYCSSVNKHTCVEIPNDNKCVFYMILDEHHLQVLGAMNIVFYMYGHINLKQPILKLLMTEALQTPSKKLFQIVAILLAEKSLLDGNATKAMSYLNKMKEYKITNANYDGINGRGDLNWFLMK